MNFSIVLILFILGAQGSLGLRTLGSAHRSLPKVTQSVSGKTGLSISGTSTYTQVFDREGNTRHKFRHVRPDGPPLNCQLLPTDRFKKTDIEQG